VLAARDFPVVCRAGCLLDRRVVFQIWPNRNNSFSSPEYGSVPKHYRVLRVFVRPDFEVLVRRACEQGIGQLKEDEDGADRLFDGVRSVLMSSRDALVPRHWLAEKRCLRFPIV